MDEKYLNEIKKCFDNLGNGLQKPVKLSNIIEQIYFAGAHAQAVKDREAVSELLVSADVDGDVIDHNMAINEALRALSAAEIEK